MPADPRYRAVRPDERTEQELLATEPHRTNKIARLAGFVTTVVALTLATASWASITSSENPSTDGSYTVSWSGVPNASSYQLYEDGTLVYDSTGTSRSFSGKTAGSYEYTLDYCEFIFDEEFCDLGSGYDALTVTVSAPAPTVSASFNKSSITLGGSVRLNWSSTNATACSGEPSIGSDATSGRKTYTPSSTGTFSVEVTCTGDGGSASDDDSVTVNPPAPTVSASFNKSSITLGDSVRLNWSSTNATACGGEPSIGSDATSGRKTYTPSSTGTFSVEVTCTGDGGSASDDDSVTVNPPAPTVSASFNKSSITLGDSVRLNWSSTNATACSGEPSIGSTATSGRKTYTPSSTGTFSVEVTCTGDGGSASDDDSVTVNPAPEPDPEPPEVTASASFNKSSITLGDSVRLNWSSTNATACSGSPSIGSTATSGSKTYTPSSTGAFSVEVTCTGAGGSASASDSVTVNAPPPTVSASFNKSSIIRGASVRLNWSSTNATACSGSPSIGSTATSGSKTYTPSSTGAFSVEVTCTGAGGSASASDSVTVNAPPPTVSASFNKSSIIRGDSVRLNWSSTNATACSGSPSIGSTATSGSKTYTPSSTGTFSVEVTCTGAGAGGSASGSDSVTVKLPAPTLTVPSTDSDGRYGVSWTRVSGATRYELEEKSGSGSFSNIYSGTSRSRNLTGKADGTYGYRVRACDSACGGWSSTGTVRVGDLTSSENPSTDGSYTVSWSPIFNAHTYQLYEDGTLVHDTTGTSRSFSGKTAGSYDYTLDYCELIFDEEHCGRASGYGTLTVTVTTPPTVTAEFNKSSITLGDSATLTWSSTHATACSGSPAIGSPATSGSKTYTPSSTGAFSVEVTCTGDGGSASDSDSVTVNARTNRAPVAVDDTAETAFETEKVIDVLGNDTDADDDDLTVTAVTTPDNGTAEISHNNTRVTYEPDGRYSGTDTFEYTVSDGSATDTGSVTVTVAAQLAAPALTVPSSDSNGSYRVSWTSVSGATSYKLQEKSGSGSFTNIYSGGSTSRTITGKAAGTYGYQVRACNSSCSDWSPTRTVRVGGQLTAEPNPSSDGSYTVSWASIPNAHSYQLYEGSKLVYDSSGTSWSASGKASGTYTYTLDFCEFVFDEEQCDLGSGYAALPVVVNVPTPEVTAEFNKSSITLGESATLTWSSTDATACSGEPSIGSDATSGKKTYTPSSTGTFSVTVTCTGLGGSDNETVSVTVNAQPNMPPMANDDTAETAFETEKVIDVLGNDTDPENDVLTVTRVTTPDNGAAEVSHNNTRVTYEPDSGYSGADTFDYTVSDGALTDTGSVTVTVAARTNTAPVAVDDTAETAYETEKVIDVLRNDTDAENDVLTVTGVTDPDNGTAGVSHNNTRVTYEPDSGYSGTDTFDYTVSDGVLTDTGSVSVRVHVEGQLTAEPNPSFNGSYTVSWAPVPNARSYQLYEGGTLVYDSSGTSWPVSGKASGTYTYTLDFCEFVFDEEQCDLGSGYRPLPVDVLEPPDLTVPATDPDGGYEASWTPVREAARYELEEMPAGGTFSEIYDGAQRSHRIAGKAVGIYKYRVRACPETGDCGYWSLTKTVKVPPGKPVLTVPATDPDGEYAVMWTTPSGATSYELQEKAGSGEWSDSEILETTSKTIMDKADGSYSYRVKACAGSDNCGEWSETGSVVVQRPVPPKVMASFDPSVITLGESSTLTWSSMHATACRGEPSIGSDGTEGMKTYTPASAGTFTVTVTCVGLGGEASAEPSVTVNTPPVAVDDTERAAFETAVPIDVLANDTDADNDVLMVIKVTTPTSGTAEITHNGSRVTYTPNSGYVGTATFHYTVSDGIANDIAMVTVSVPPDVPVLTVPATDPDGEYAVMWTTPSGATGYELQEKAGSGEWSDSEILTTTSKTIMDKADGTYSYRVKACAGSDNCGDWSATATVGVGVFGAIPNPSFDGNYTVFWPSVAGATSYELQEKVGSGEWSNSETLTTTRKEYTGKTPAIYMYRVRACTAMDNCGSWSSTLTVTVPIPPELTVPATDADGDYEVRWGRVSRAERYELEEMPDGGTFSEIHDGAQRSHQVTGKAVGIYRYRVRACPETGDCGYWSSTEPVTVEREQEPPEPPRLTVPETDPDGDYPASWNGVTDATRYELEEMPAGGTFSEIYDGPELGYQIMGRSPGIYKYRVRGCPETGDCGGWSETKTTKVPPGTPELTVPGKAADSGYDATWTIPSGATSYELQEKVGSGEWSDSEILMTNTKRYADKAPAIYRYRVKACAGSDNCGDWSETKRTRVPPGVPDLTVPATDADGRYSVSWTSPAGATRYRLVEMSDNITRYYNFRSTSFAIRYRPDGTHRYRVRACAGSNNCGDWSQTKSVVVGTPPAPANSAPVAVDDEAETPFGTPVEIAVLANDTDADGDDLTVTAVTTPDDGTVTVTSDADGNDTLVTYTPGSDHPGTDTFDYTVSDGTATDTGTVEVTVGFVKVTPNPSTTGSYRLSWQGSALLADWYRVLESAADGAPPVLSEHLGTSVDYTGKATGNYYYTVESCTQSFEEDETCEELGSASARVVLPITPGNLPYRSGVTKGGDAYVNVPIAPVPGVNGLAPRLSIDYSGGRERHRSDQELPADMIGYGWRVGGFSTIRRCVKGTADSDGISFDDTDALCLDGEPLEKIKGDTDDPEVPPEYRTARESFAKIVMKDSATGDWFEVHLPDGAVREYGNTLDSQLWKPAREATATEEAEPAAAFLWSINKQTDAFGNVMTYAYYEDNEALARHPKKVAYGDGDPGDATIEFVYRPRDDLDSTQVGSYFLSQPQRLTYIHLRLGGSLVRDYRLAYETTGTGQVRLDGLQTCGYEPSGAFHCLEPLEIGWRDVAGGTWVDELTDPMGVATTFAIGTITESGTHDFVLDAMKTPFGATSLPANARALPARGGDVKPVVTGVTRSDGIGGTRQTSYAYLGRGVENTRNWGFLGFHAIRETDEASGIVTYTQYRLDYPYFGRPAQVVRYDGNYTSTKTPLSKRAVRYAEKTVSHTGSTVTTTLPYAEETMRWLHEGTSTLGAVQTTEALTLDAGLVSRVVRETRTGHRATGDGDGGSDWGAGASHTLRDVQRTTQRTLSFDNDETDWVLGFVDDIDVKHYDGDTGDTLDWTETVERTAIAGTLAPDVVTRFPNDDTESGDNSGPDDDFEHQTDYDYDSRGNRESASETADDATRTWEIEGFGAGRFPTSWKNPLNHTERATHNVGLGVPATTTDANNRRTSYAYDGLGREISRTRHWDSVTTTDENGETTTEDVKTTTTYAPCDDGTCDAVAATVASCGTRYSVAPVMKVTTSAPDMPDSTAYLDMYGRAIRTVVEGFSGVDRRVDMFYDARGRAVCESEPYHAGETAEYTRYTYDIRDRLTRATRPDGGVTRVEYAAASNRVTATVTETVKASDGATATTRKTKRMHNVLGELTSVTEGAAEAASEQVTTSYAYDGAGRLDTVTTEGLTTTFAYDAAGNRASVTNPNLGATVNAGTATNMELVSVKFDYNGYGELTERTDARGATYYGYDKLGRRTCAADRGGTATWEYDDASNGKGLLERRSYDRDTVRTSASSCAFGSDFTETYTYNTDARLETVTTAIMDDRDPATTTTLTRSHTYDDYGRLASTTYPSAVTVAHEYNARGYAAKLKHGSTVLVNVTEQTAHGQSKAVSYGNGVRTQRSYDELGRLEDIDTTRNTVTLQDNTYAWRSDGSLESRIAGAAGSRVKREEEFDYDYLNRLTDAETYISDASTASRTLAFGYDLRGNLETKTSDVSADDNVTNVYPTTSNRLTSATIGDVPYEFPHDTSGHIEQYECTDPDDSDDVDPCAGVDDTFIEWNARGLAEKVTVGESKTDATPTARDSFHYGPDGARYFKKTEWAVTSGTTTTKKTSRKYYAGAYEKTVTAGGDTVERTRIGDAVVHVRTTPASMMASPSSVFEYMHRDHLGSVEAVTNEAGTELVVLGHDPYGERRDNDWTGQLTDIETLLSGHGERVSRGFTGHEHLDRTGLIHMNGRVYDPRLGRFLSPDPIVGDPTSSQSWNLYSYVGNNPLSYVDPTGLIQEGWCDGITCLHLGGGGAGGGSTTRTTTVTTTETVHGVMAVPYRYAVPVWTRVGGSAWPGGNDYVYDLTYDYFWGVDYQPYSYTYNVTRTVAVEDQSPADEPADMGGLGIAAADVGASILIPGYDLLRCNMEGDCDWADWVIGIGEIAVSATGVGYGVRVAAKAGIKGAYRSRAVIGKLEDLESVGEYEHTLLKHLPNQGSPRANWKQNSSVLRQEMRKGQPIRDSSAKADGTLDKNTGFLRAERNLLENHGWRYDPSTRTWNPPR